uniref:Uncharacterized protein n=1 Tax=Anguilla anguilla TaxID=7936 RepID=A0A0E9PNC5_ANGAN
MSSLVVNYELLMIATTPAIRKMQGNQKNFKKVSKLSLTAPKTAWMN